MALLTEQLDNIAWLRFLENYTRVAFDGWFNSVGVGLILSLYHLSAEIRAYTMA